MDVKSEPDKKARLKKKTRQRFYKYTPTFIVSPLNKDSLSRSSGNSHSQAYYSRI